MAAWVEIFFIWYNNLTALCCSFMAAWVEIRSRASIARCERVAALWLRGLKYLKLDVSSRFERLQLYGYVG